MAWLFGKRKDAASAAPAEEEKPPETPADQIKSWQRKLKAEARGLDRQIRSAS